MPQLDPSPWFAIMVFSWSMFLIMLPPKILSHTFPGEPTALSTEKTKTEPWNWPWH
uniref:ATP synthase complex subunit 8 n=1 Tax=Xenodermichthys copei TaxID=492051 RepID=D0Z6N5_9TELE|nr:ATP synthase F0 subunit 8 [Xenodermichthys copei]BAI50328.1 ATPase subunits 8 [Xenodermichthys copei]BBA85447.1 ATPase subunits 8 [Xenodermichthys copei]